MNKTTLEKLKLETGQKIDLFLTEVGRSPHNVVFDGIKEYNNYGVSDVYILYHRVEAVKLEDIRKIDVVKQGEELESSDANNIDRANTTDNTSVTDSPAEEQNKEQDATNETSTSVKKYECSCGKVYSHYASWYQHAKKTGHSKIKEK